MTRRSPISAPPADAPGSPRPPSPDRPGLRIAGLRITGRTQSETESVLVDDLDLTVNPGDRVALVGESGSGKSLTLLAAIGLLPTSVRSAAGTIEVDGHDLGLFDQRQLTALRGKTVGLIPQGAVDSLSPTWTIGFQLRETLRQHRNLRGAALREAARAALEEVALEQPDDILDAWPHQLSGGQAQRVAIALALAGKPQYLLADEPTTGLDTLTQHEILRLLDRNCRPPGPALLLVTHDLASVVRLCSRVYVILAGRILEEGPTTLLLKHALHPYTRRLLSGDRPAGPTSAQVSSDDGCPWASRCDLVRPACRDRLPALVNITSDHRSRCPVTCNGGDPT